MSENCTSGCGSCSQSCSSRVTAEKTDFSEKLHEQSSVKKVIGIVSGKGGVGKSLVTSLLASGMNKKGFRVAVLDADITGPSIPKAFGLKAKAAGDGNSIHPVISNGGIQVMSMNFLLENETDPVMWRGPVIAGAVKQFWTDVIWQDVDYMFVDMPPGTGDVPLTVFQSLSVDGIIVVGSPQELVGMIVEKALKMAVSMNIPVLALVENMSYVECPDCNKKIEVFGKSQCDDLAKKHSIPITAKLPINPLFAAACDKGAIESVETDSLDGILTALTKLA